MYFESLAALASMDGHGAYVWSAYAIVFAVLGALVVRPLARQHRLLARVRRRLHADAAEGG